MKFDTHTGCYLQGDMMNEKEIVVVFYQWHMHCLRTNGVYITCMTKGLSLSMTFDVFIEYALFPVITSVKSLSHKI